MRSAAALLAALTLAGCVGAPKPASPVLSRPAPQTAGPVAAPSSQSFLAPTIMRLPGLESVIGADARRLGEIFGPARLIVP